MPMTRRHLLLAGSVGGALALDAFRPVLAQVPDDGRSIVEGILGRRATESDRLELVLPGVFPNGSAVPMTFHVDSPMTAADHVRRVRVFAPLNPIVEVMSFRFEPAVGVPRVSTRIRLAGPQHVMAVAEMSDGSLLLAKRFVDVATNGCGEE